MLRATPQLYAQPRPCSGSIRLMGRPQSIPPKHKRTHIGVCSLDTNRRAVLARIQLDGSATLDAARAAIGHGAAIRPADLRVPAIVKLVLHPCQQAASHLPCTRPPDRLLPGRPRASFRGARRGSHYRAAQRAFVTTSGLDFQRCRLEGAKMLRPQLPSLAQLRDPFVVLRLLHRRTTCGHRRFALLARCVHAARPLRSWVHRASHVSGGHFLYLLLL
jgi:hypothetical protein